MEEERKKLLFVFVFSTYLPVFLLKFWSRELIGCRIKFHIQRVPTRHTFDGPRYPKNKKYLKKRDDDVIITFFQVFLVFGVAGSVKSMSSGYLLDGEFNSASNEYPHCILLTDPATPKQEIPEKTWWWHHHHVFSGISCFWGIEVRQKYAKWVRVGWEI